MKYTKNRPPKHIHILEILIKNTVQELHAKKYQNLKTLSSKITSFLLIMLLESS